MRTNWDPFFDFLELKNEAARSRPSASTATASSRRFAPVVDVFETEKAFCIKAELPGVRAEDVDVQVDKNVLTLKGERRFEREGHEEKESLHRIERAYGSFARSFALSEAVDAEKIEAELKDGVLTVRLPKKAAVLPRRVEVKISAPSAPSAEPRVRPPAENGAAARA